MSTKEFFIDHWSEITLTLGGIFAFFTGRRLHKSEEKASQLQNIEKVREMEVKLLADMEDMVNKLLKNNDQLETIIERQAKKLTQYRNKFGEL